ncbi:hypothetical protein [Lysobacter xanthus]
MNRHWNLLKALKPASIVVVFVVWNAIGLCGVHLNGGAGRIRTPASGLLMAVDCVLLAAAAAAVALSPAWQRRALRPGADIASARPGLWFIVAIAGFLAIAGGVSAVGLLRGHA